MSEWIRVTDRLPEKDGRYLCTARWNSDARYEVEILEYGTATLEWRNKSRLFDGKGFGEDWSVGNTFAEIDNVREVIAWMPLPKQETERRTEMKIQQYTKVIENVIEITRIYHDAAKWNEDLFNQVEEWRHENDIPFTGMNRYILDWANEFEEKNAGEEWWEKDYIEAIDKFTISKLKELVKQEENMVKITKLPVTYEVCGWVDVPESTIEEAIDYFNENMETIKLPTDTEYVDGSFQLSTEEPEEIEAMLISTE